MHPSKRMTRYGKLLPGFLLRAVFEHQRCQLPGSPRTLPRRLRQAFRPHQSRRYYGRENQVWMQAAYNAAGLLLRDFWCDPVSECEHQSMGRRLLLRYYLQKLDGILPHARSKKDESLIQSEFGDEREVR